MLFRLKVYCDATMFTTPLLRGYIYNILISVYSVSCRDTRQQPVAMTRRVDAATLN